MYCDHFCNNKIWLTDSCWALFKNGKSKEKKKIPKMLEMLGVVASSRTYFLMTANISYTQLCFVPSFVKSLGSRS